MICGLGKYVPSNQTPAFVSAFQLDLQSDKMAENWASPCTGISCLKIICFEERSQNLVLRYTCNFMEGHFCHHTYTPVCVY